MRFKSLYLAMTATALSSVALTATAQNYTNKPLTEAERNTPFQYTRSHVFSIPDEIKDRPISDISIPGTHNSFNTPGSSGLCVKGTPAAAPNSNTDRDIHYQITKDKVRLVEIDVYKKNGRYCVFHGANGEHRLDGNTFHFHTILDQIIDAQAEVNDIIFIKMDGGSSLDRDEALIKHFTEKDLDPKKVIYINGRGQDYDGNVKGDTASTPPTYNQLVESGIKFVFVAGSQTFNFGWSLVGTSPKYQDSIEDTLNPFANADGNARSKPLSEKINRTNGQQFVRWNAFALNVAGFGDKGKQEYLTARLVGHGVEKWIQGAHRVSQIITDYGGMISTGMSSARAANIMNQVPSAYGTIRDENGKALTVNVNYKVFFPNINLRDDNTRLTSGDYINRGFNIVAPSTFDFPRPHGQSIVIRPYKKGYRFEPASITLKGYPTNQHAELKFTAYKEDYSLQKTAESYSFIQQEGPVKLAAGLDVNANGDVIVKDTTKHKGFALVNKRYGMCVGLPRNKPLQNGRNLYLQDCDGSERQTWNYDPDTGYIHSATGYCIVTGGKYDDNRRLFAKKACSEKGNLGASFGLAGHSIIASGDTRYTFDSNGGTPGAPLILWHKGGYHHNRNWAFEKHYPVSSTNENTVTDPSTDNLKQHFLLSNDQGYCLGTKTIGDYSQVSARACRTHHYDKSDNANKSFDKLWFENKGKISQKPKNDNTKYCLSHNGKQPPFLELCQDLTPQKVWNFRSPFGDQKPIMSPAYMIEPRYNNPTPLVLTDTNAEGGNTYVTLDTGRKKFKYQAWFVIPVESNN